MGKFSREKIMVFLQNKYSFLAFLISFFLFWGGVFAVSFQDIAEQKPKGFISDFAGMLDNENILETIAQRTEKNTTGEIAVVTIDALPRDHTIETFATELFEKWGIGKKENDNGILLLIAAEDRKFKIETGYGMEGVLPDILAKRITDTYLVPDFKTGNYDNGVLQTVLALEKIYMGNAEEVRAETADTTPFPEWFLFAAIAWVIIWKWFQNPFQGTGLAAGIPVALWIAGGFGVFLYIIILLFSFLKGEGGGNFGGGGGFSGGSGFGGFGGGMSGGGGVSGSW